MRLVVNCMVAFKMSKHEVLWRTSFAFLNWMLSEYNEMHSKKENEVPAAKQSVIDFMKKTGNYGG